MNGAETAFATNEVAKVGGDGVGQALPDGPRAGACIAAGITLGHRLPALVQTIERAEYAQINLPVALLAWAMIIPISRKIELGVLHQVKEH